MLSGRDPHTAGTHRGPGNSASRAAHIVLDFFVEMRRMSSKSTGVQAVRMVHILRANTLALMLVTLACGTGDESDESDESDEAAGSAMQSELTSTDGGTGAIPNPCAQDHPHFAGSCSEAQPCFELYYQNPVELEGMVCGGSTLFEGTPCDTSEAIGRCISFPQPQCRVRYWFPPTSVETAQASCEGNFEIL